MNNSTTECQWSEAFEMGPFTASNTPSVYVELFFYPVLLFICTIGNSLVLAVFIFGKTATSTPVYLTAVAISDLFVLWFYLPDYLLQVHAALDPQAAEIPDSSFPALLGFIQFWRNMCLHFSDWTLIVFSVARLRSIIEPYSTPEAGAWVIRRTILIEILLLVLAILYSLSYLVTHYYFLAHDDGISTMQDLLTPGLLRWYTLQNDAEVGLRIGEWLTVVIVDVILIVVIYRYFRAAPTQPGTIQSISIRSRSSYPIIIVSVFSYTLTQFPNLIYRILQTASRPPYCSYNFTSKEDAAARPIVLMLFLTNYAINFILYCAVSAKFRAQLIEIKVRAIGGLVKLQKTRRGTLTTRVSMEESVPVETPLQQFGIHRGSSVRLIETE